MHLWELTEPGVDIINSLKRNIDESNITTGLAVTSAQYKTSPEKIIKLVEHYLFLETRSASAGVKSRPDSQSLKEWFLAWTLNEKSRRKII